jgi:hypothetical protein
LASTATLVSFGGRLGWLGMVLTAPEFRRRGFARMLVAHALEAADRHGITTVKLDATDQGRPLYQALGFMDEQPVERWLGAGTDGADETQAAAGSISTDLDQQAWLVDRSKMLDSLAARGQAYGAQDGFLLTRPGACASFLGPCIAERPETAEALIGGALAARPGAWFWDLLPANGNAVHLARRFGFGPVRALTRMYRGRALRGNEALAYALAGFELG